MDKKQIDEMIEAYINACERMNDFYRTSDAVFKEIIDRYPDIKERWEFALQQHTFAAQVDEALDGRRSQYNALKVCDTPKLLIDAGMEQLPMLFTQKHLRDCTHPKEEGKSNYHGLAPEQIKRLPELIAAPAMLYDSLTRDDSVIIVTTEVDHEKQPVIISVRPNGVGTYELEKITSNFITSVYGRSNFPEHIEKVINEEKLLYCSEQKSRELFRVSEVQFPGCLNRIGFNVILHQSRNIVKSDLEKPAERQQEGKKIRSGEKDMPPTKTRPR